MDTVIAGSTLDAFRAGLRGAAYAHLAYVAEEMRPYETGATYVNFLDFGDWNPERTRASYSPEDWDRLVELKDRYDPDNLFRFNRNIPPTLAAR